MIQFENVVKKYKTKNGDLTAVKDVNLTINYGQIVGLIGFSGAGKSTLVRILAGLETPTSGQILINGTNLSALKGHKLRQKRQKIGMVFQHFNLLWSRTVLQNILLPLEIAGINKTQRMTRAHELAKLVGLSEKENAYPAELSGGQKQRVGIARALANNPDILISDEATSALDPETTNEILDLLLKINQEVNVTILLITHEMHAVAKVCSQVAVMENGQIVETGSVTEVFKHPKEQITKQFVADELNGKVGETSISVPDLLSKYPNGKIVRLTFDGPKTEMPIVSDVIRQFPEVQLNILQGSIHQTQKGAIGSLDVQLIGSDKDVAGVINEISRLEVESEVLGHV